MTLNEYIRTKGGVVAAAKGTHLFRQGEEDKHLYYVTTGLFKAYYLTPNGQESIKSFISAGHVIASMLSIFNDEPCAFNVCCLEACDVIRIPSAELITLAESDPVLALEMQHLLRQLAMKKERREYELLCLTAEERYRLFMQGSPELAGRITQNDMARYLGLTPVGLSRIKKRLSSPTE